MILTYLTVISFTDVWAQYICYVKNILQKIFFSFFTLEEHQSKSKLAKVLQKLTFLDELEEKQDVRKYRTLVNV